MVPDPKADVSDHLTLRAILHPATYGVTSGPPQVDHSQPVRCGPLVTPYVAGWSIALSVRWSLTSAFGSGTICFGVRVQGLGLTVYRGTPLKRKRSPLGPYRRPVPRVLGGSQGGGRFLMSEVPLQGLRIDGLWLTIQGLGFRVEG